MSSEPVPSQPPGRPQGTGHPQPHPKGDRKPASPQSPSPQGDRKGRPYTIRMREAMCPHLAIFSAFGSSLLGSPVRGESAIVLDRGLFDKIGGPNRELNLEYEPGGDELKFVTEVQFAVEKR